MKFIVLLLALFNTTFLHGHCAKSAKRETNTIVCVHGFLGSRWNMNYFAKNFQGEGWRVLNWGYKSREKCIAEHGADLVAELKLMAQREPGKPLYFCTHSLGGLVLRAALNHPDCPNEAKIGKALLLGPPNQGSCMGRFLNRFYAAREFAKDRSGLELFTQQDFHDLGEFPSTLQVLVIAGDLGFNPCIEGKNDGLVAVAETYLETPHKHLVFKVGHASMLMSRKAYKAASYFFHH